LILFCPVPVAGGTPAECRWVEQHFQRCVEPMFPEKALAAESLRSLEGQSLP